MGGERDINMTLRKLFLTQENVTVKAQLFWVFFDFLQPFDSL